MGDKHSFNANIVNKSTFNVDIETSHSFTANLVNSYRFLLALVGVAYQSTFGIVNIKQKFGGFITGVQLLKSISVNFFVKGSTIIINKLLLTLNPRVTVYGGISIVTVIIRQLIQIRQSINMLVRSPQMRIVLRERIKSNPNILIKSPNINTNITVRQYNHLYNISGCTINDVSNLTLNQLSYTEI